MHLPFFARRVAVIADLRIFPTLKPCNVQHHKVRSATTRRHASPCAAPRLGLNTLHLVVCQHPVCAPVHHLSGRDEHLYRVHSEVECAICAAAAAMAAAADENAAAASRVDAAAACMGMVAAGRAESAA